MQSNKHFLRPHTLVNMATPISNTDFIQCKHYCQLAYQGGQRIDACHQNFFYFHAFLGKSWIASLNTIFFSVLLVAHWSHLSGWLAVFAPTFWACVSLPGGKTGSEKGWDRGETGSEMGQDRGPRQGARQGTRQGWDRGQDRERDGARQGARRATWWNFHCLIFELLFTASYVNGGVTRFFPTFIRLK